MCAKPKGPGKRLVHPDPLNQEANQRRHHEIRAHYRAVDDVAPAHPEQHRRNRQQRNCLVNHRWMDRHVNRRQALREGNCPGQVAWRPGAVADEETADPSNGVPDRERRRRSRDRRHDRQPLTAHQRSCRREHLRRIHQTNSVRRGKRAAPSNRRNQGARRPRAAWRRRPRQIHRPAQRPQRIPAFPNGEVRGGRSRCPTSAAIASIAPKLVTSKPRISNRTGYMRVPNPYVGSP